jgi:hypothetical protein
MRSTFPIVGRAKFDQHPKSRKTKDVERMLCSSTSEDWVTWTAFWLLKTPTPETWWANFVELVCAENSPLSLPHGWEQKPEDRLWETVASPEEYETASRHRMRWSGDTKWVARSYKPAPVEGPSEIDVTLCNATMLVFVECKLGSDISLCTEYDPRRNQIVRNIDCLLDKAGGRFPIFWMLVRDAGQDRSYTQLLRYYRAQPDALVCALPHHDPDRVVALAQTLGLILWKGLVHDVIQLSTDDDEETRLIKNELSRRVRGG